jgi:hypothetical protein
MLEVARLVMVRVDVANDVVLLVRLRETGLADRKKGTTLTETLADRESEPLTPVTLTE